jgi:hypothetical protein
MASSTSDPAVESLSALCKIMFKDAQIVCIVMMEPRRRKLRVQIFFLVFYLFNMFLCKNCAYLNALISQDNWSLGTSGIP